MRYRGNVVPAGPFDPNAGGVAWGDSPLYGKVMGTGFHSEVDSPVEILKRLNTVERDLPIGSQFRIEKIYRMTRGYEPGKPRSGSVMQTTYLELLEHGHWYDPKTGKAKPARWKKTVVRNDASD